MSKGKKALKVIGIILGSLIALVIVVHIILNITFSIQLRNKIAELKAQGRPMTIAEIVPPPVPDKDNAALLYNKAFALMQSEGNKPTEMIKIIKEVKSFSDISQWTDEQRKVIPELIKSRDAQYIYELLKEGSEKPKCNFNLEYEKGLEMLAKHLSPMQSAVRLLCIKALLEAESGNVTEAFDTLLVGLKMANHLKDEPILISQLVRVNFDGGIIECIKSISDSKGITPEQANLIMNELSTHEGIEPFIKCMDGERVVCGGWIFENILKGNISNMSWMLRNIGNIEEGDTLGRRISLSLFSYLYRPICKKDYIYYLTLMSKMRDKYNLPYYETTQEISIDQQIDQLPKYYILIKMLSPSFERMLGLAAEYQANIEVCRVGLALKIYKAKDGNYPETLSKLVPDFLNEIPIDPFTGKDLIYSKDMDGFKLYSLGPNMQDDFGTPRVKKDNDPAYMNYDIVWESKS